MLTSDHLPVSPDQVSLANSEWELSDLIQLITAELDQAQDTLILRSQNRRLSMMVNQLSLDLQVDVRHDPSGHLKFRTAPSGQPGTTVLKLGFTPTLDTQIQETRKSVDLELGDYRQLETLAGISQADIQQLKTVGIHSVNDLELATQTSAMLTEVAAKTGVAETQLRLWRQLPFITQLKPGNGAPGSIVVMDGGNLGSTNDSIEVYFQDRPVRVLERTSTRLMVEMPRSVTGPGLVWAKVGQQKTNLQSWRADVADLCVQDILIDYTLSAQQTGDVSFRAVLTNQGDLDVIQFKVTWSLFQVWSSRFPLPDYSLKIGPVLDDSQAAPTQLIQQISYIHGPLLPHQQSTDSAMEFRYYLDQPGTYRVSVFVEPDNSALDQQLSNNRFTKEFVVYSNKYPFPDSKLPSNVLQS